MRRRVVLSGLVLVAFSLGFIIPTFTSTSDPVFPDVVTSENISQLPEMIPVADSHGELAGYTKREDVFGPPPAPPGTAAAAYATSQGTPVYDASGTKLVGYVDQDGFRPRR